jgi:hypothetical protein
MLREQDNPTPPAPLDLDWQLFAACAELEVEASDPLFFCGQGQSRLANQARAISVPSVRCRGSASSSLCGTLTRPSTGCGAEPRRDSVGACADGRARRFGCIASRQHPQGDNSRARRCALRAECGRAQSHRRPEHRPIEGQQRTQQLRRTGAVRGGSASSLGRPVVKTDALAAKRLSSATSPGRCCSTVSRSRSRSRR